jgi:hypothetical protein
MKPVLRLALLLCLCCPILAWAQITFEWTDLPVNPGTVADYQFNTFLSPIALSPGSAGPDQTWDFTNISVSNSEQQTWVDPATTPHYSLYPPEANRCYTIGNTTYGYWGITPSGWSWYGYDAIVYQDVTPLLALPCDYGNYWTTSWWYTPYAQATSEVSIESEVDGWGTLTDAMGSLPCLRIKRHWTQTLTSQGDRTVSTTWRYEWVVQEHGIVATMESMPDDPDSNFTQGIFRRMVSISTGVRPLPAESSLPNQVALSPAYPNPFNPTTQLSFSLVKSGNISLAVVDLQGRQVAELARGWFAGGRYQATFDGATLATGLYLARLNVEGAVYVQKLVLMK